MSRARPDLSSLPHSSPRVVPVPAAQPVLCSGGAGTEPRIDENGSDGDATSAAAGAASRPVYVPRGRLLAYLGLVALSWLVPKRRTKVLLHSPSDIEDGVISVVDELAARGWKATVLLEDPAREPTLRRLASGSFDTVPLSSVRALGQFLTARYVMSTESVFGGFRSPPSQVSVNLWHGEPPTKATGRFGTGRGLHSTYSPVCSTIGRAYRCAEFGLHPRGVPIVGAPRNDRMLRAHGPSVRAALLDGSTGAAYLWLPSFRVGSWGSSQRVDSADTHPGLPFDITELSRLDEWLIGRGVQVLVKLHPRDLSSFPGEYRAIRVLTENELEHHGLTLYTALPAFDGLITDMSSIWVDYLLVDKPMIFAFPDVDNYRRGRGLNLEPYEHWVPGLFARTMDQLINALDDLTAGRDPMAAERARARLRFHQHTDDLSTSRLLDGLGIHRAAVLSPPVDPTSTLG